MFQFYIVRLKVVLNRKNSGEIVVSILYSSIKRGADVLYKTLMSLFQFYIVRLKECCKSVHIELMWCFNSI